MEQLTNSKKRKFIENSVYVFSPLSILPFPYSTNFPFYYGNSRVIGLIEGEEEDEEEVDSSSLNSLSFEKILSCYIPEPIWQHIFSFFATGEKANRINLGNFRLVCKKFRDLISPFWLQKIKLTEVMYYCFKFPLLTSSIRSLYISSKKERHTLLPKSLFALSKAFGTSFCSLREFYAHSSITDNEIQHLPSSLTLLNLSNCKFITDRAFHFLPSNLQVLNLSSNLCNGMKVTGSTFSLLTSCLKSLNLCGLTQLSTRNLQNLPSSLQKLSLGSIYEYYANGDIDDSALESLPKGLIELDIIGCPKVSDIGIKKLPTTLQSLDISGCYNISDEGIVNIGNHLKNLKFLKFDDIQSKGDSFRSLNIHLDMLVRYSPANPMIASVLFKNMQSLQHFVEILKVNVNFTNACGETALHVACKKKDPQFVKYLLDHGANINAVSYYGDNPLHCACSSAKGVIEIIDLLIQRGVNINQVNKKKETPLHHACLSGLDEIVDYLIQKGAKINIGHAANHNEKVVVVSFTRFSSYPSSVQKILIQHGVVINKKQSRNTPNKKAKISILF